VNGRCKLRGCAAATADDDGKRFKDDSNARYWRDSYATSLKWSIFMYGLRSIELDCFFVSYYTNTYSKFRYYCVI
jgi:hypothetical protein